MVYALSGIRVPSDGGPGPPPNLSIVAYSAPYIMLDAEPLPPAGTVGPYGVDSIGMAFTWASISRTVREVAVAAGGVAAGSRWIT